MKYLTLYLLLACSCFAERGIVVANQSPFPIKVQPWGVGVTGSFFVPAGHNWQGSFADGSFAGGEAFDLTYQDTDASWYPLSTGEFFTADGEEIIYAVVFEVPGGSLGAKLGAVVDLGRTAYNWFTFGLKFGIGAVGSAICVRVARNLAPREAGEV